MITHLEPDILECGIKWALGSITTNKASEDDGTPAELFQILKDDSVKVLYWIGQCIWKTRQWPQEWERWVFTPIPKKGNAREYSIEQMHTFHMLAIWYSKSLKLGFNSTWTENFQMYKLDLEKTEEPGVKLPTCVGSKKKNPMKTSISASLTTLKPLTSWITTSSGKFLMSLE